MHVEKLVNGVLREMESRGYAKSTVASQKRCYDLLIRWFEERNEGIYNADVLRTYVSKYKNSMLRQEITPNHYQTIRRSANYIQEYAETGVIGLSREPGVNQYNPSKESIEIIVLSLDASKMTERDKDISRKALRKFFCFIESRGLKASDINVEVIIEFIHQVRDSNSGSMNKVARALKTLVGYLASANIISDKPDLSWLVPKTRHIKVISPYTQEEVGAILSSFDKGTPLGKRNYAIILLACGTGLRGCDILNLKLSDIDWESGEMNIIQSKTKRSVKIHLSGQIRNAISDYVLDGRPDSMHKNVFLKSRAPFVPIGNSSLVRILDRASLLAKVPHKHWRAFHSMRRSFGTWLVKEEVPVDTVSQMLGQADIRSSRAYISFDDTQMSSCALGFDDIPLNGGVYV